MNIEQVLLEIKEDIGIIKGKIEGIEKNMNGTIKRMNEHIREGIEYRQCIERNTAYRKAFIWAFGIIGLILTILGGVVLAVAKQVFK